MHNPLETQNTIAVDEIKEYREHLAALADPSSPADDISDLAALDTLLDEVRHCDELIRTDYFVEYITDIIKDCYDDIPNQNKTGWPYYCLKMDYEMAARDAKQDYTSVTYAGVDYFAR